MVKVREDMTGWIMSEHGVPNSRLKIIKQIDDYISNAGLHYAQYLCECLCEEHKQVVATASHIKCGTTLSCGCLQKERTLIANKKENKKDLSGSYGVIWSTNTNEEIYFDLEDAPIILQYTWRVDRKGYAVTSITVCSSKQKSIKMHRLLGYYHPDHHNRNKLDNRRENLIPCTQQENSRNHTIQKNNTSGITGVNFSKSANGWVARINDNNGCRMYLGCFTDKNDAIKTRLKAEKQYYGEFAPQKHLFEQYGINDKEINYEQESDMCAM